MTDKQFAQLLCEIKEVHLTLLELQSDFLKDAIRRWRPEASPDFSSEKEDEA